jgi:hypothetical protein
LRIAALGALQLGLKLPLGGPLGLFGFLGRRIGRQRMFVATLAYS